MAVTSNRNISVSYSGDFSATPTLPTAVNTTSPASISLVTLATGNNTISVPTGAKSCTISFPTGNTFLVTLKGVNGDTGVFLHKTDPTSFGIDSTMTSFVLNAATGLDVRLIWG